MRCLFCSNPDTWCPSGGETVSSKDIAAQVKSVAPYLRPGGGGVTCSGGEPMLQPDFTAAVFQEAHALGLTTCLDTTGQGSKHHNWDKVLPHTDMVSSSWGAGVAVSFCGRDRWWMSCRLNGRSRVGSAGSRWGASIRRHDNLY